MGGVRNMLSGTCTRSLDGAARSVARDGVGASVCTPGIAQIPDGLVAETVPAHGLLEGRATRHPAAILVMYHGLGEEGGERNGRDDPGL